MHDAARLMDRARYESGLTFQDFLVTAVKNAELWRMIAARAEVPDEVASEVAELGGRWHLAVLNEDWCGDAVNTVPVIAKLAERAPNLDTHIFGRDANPDLMNAHLTGESRSIPAAILYDDDFTERGWWGPRPRELQSWVKGEGMSLDKDDRYRQIRTWYARDRGATTLREVVEMIRTAAVTAP